MRGRRAAGALLAKHGTYEMIGIAFSDEQDIWWLETVGGHHWIARRVTEDYYATMPDQLGVANSLHILELFAAHIAPALGSKSNTEGPVEGTVVERQ